MNTSSLYFPQIYPFCKMSLATLPLNEEQALIVKMLGGSRVARDTLLFSNLRFIISLAKRYAKHGLDLDELTAEGIIGFINGIKKISPERNTRLITFVKWDIRNAIFFALNKSGSSLRLSARKYRQKVQAGAEKKSLPQEEPFLSLEDVSFDSALIEKTSPEENAVNACIREQVKAAVYSLPKAERAVIILYYGINGGPCLTYTKIANRLGKSKQWASRKAQAGLVCLRHSLRHLAP